MIPDNAPDMTYVDPPSPAYYEDRLFDISNATLNRDDSLVPYARVRQAFRAAGKDLRTADYLMKAPKGEAVSNYYSLGVLDNYKALLERADVCLKAFIIFEPPVVDPRLYKALPELTAAFETVYVHNTIGDGYSLKGVDLSKLRQLYWPQPRDEVILQCWERSERLDRIVVINGNHIPRKVPHELYSKRIEAMAALAPLGVVDLYGRGWAKWWSRASMWLPYWRNRKTLMSIYKGACDSKYEVLSQYKFSLCFENMAMKGYVTEKIFDCLYSGTIPLYLGAPDIAALVPSNTYVDCRAFKSWSEAYDAMMKITPAEIMKMRNAGRNFIRSEDGLKFYDSLNHVFFAD
ncbi:MULTISPECIES: glycosyltransferase family 10 [unclassified Polaromonas]|uniref:glycosyltransferase family 10 domain-containing protein n=1 Tax=unclassified Polaromonas TaxID=2638319 RepID=UPI0025CDA97E|nr:MULTISPECIES: glycosyltransferase family 10 [unclassified Polaromonas]HQS39488.1 glycosyltransferase family 10 [Polaromonas sp.]HQS88644.1 glycosyltransferase family 10 [Polaromonas sp.]HQT07145.1 glycosyltransferase family 10 [Polaromonas sp.]